MYNELLFLSSILLTVAMSVLALHFGSQALVAAFVMQGIAANLLILKEIDLFGFCVTAADIFIIGMVLCLNLIQEYYGQETSQNAIKAYILSLVWFLGLQLIHLEYLPSQFDKFHLHFAALFNLAPRLVATTLLVSWVSLHLDRRLFAFLSNRFPTSHLAWRSFGAMVVAQFVDTILFTYLGLSGIMSNPGHIIMVSYTIKVIAAVGMTPCLILIQWIFNQTQKTT